ncbi:hypothetical protein [Methylobacterium sp. NFXW15]|uniref:hypothetical protein n=1 Tax=Methylobacterium sp. NFXW15 TaxID=2819512 RepID=UPI003CEBC471
MPIPRPTPRRIALLGLLLASLVMLADWTARIELARAVSAAPADGGRVVAQVAGADD